MMLFTSHVATMSDDDIYEPCSDYE